VAGAITAIVDEQTRQAEAASLRRLATAGGVLVALFAIVLLVPAGLYGQLTS
jgi:hypothetical protein